MSHSLSCSYKLADRKTHLGRVGEEGEGLAGQISRNHGFAGWRAFCFELITPVFDQSEAANRQMKALSLVSGNRGLALLGVGWLLACCMTVLLVDDNGGETILLGGAAVVSVCSSCSFLSVKSWNLRFCTATFPQMFKGLNFQSHSRSSNISLWWWWMPMICEKENQRQASVKHSKIVCACTQSVHTA